MIVAKPQDRELIVETLTKAFNQNRSVNYVVQQDRHRINRIRKLMDYSFNYCHAFGQVFLSDDRKCCALIMLPAKKKTTLNSILWDISLAFSVIGIRNIQKVMKRESLVKSHHPVNEEFAYLWFIGVSPENQGAGSGSRLLDEILKLYSKEGMPVYLETSVEKNIDWYQKAGFENYNTLELSYTLFLFRRKPQSVP